MADLQPLDGRVLLVEDSRETLRLFACILRTAGAVVTVAQNGFAAVELALAHDPARSDEPFDVILMDMEMPLMDGFEATRRLRAGGYKGPIVAVTTFNEDGDQEACLECGCTSYVPKPIERPDLIALVRQHLRHNSKVESASSRATG